MNTEQLRAEFEAWAARIGLCVTGKYAETINGLCAESAFKAGYKAALQSQDSERLDFITSKPGVCYALVSDDNGRWALTDAGMGPVAPDQGFTETVGITSIVDPDMWKSSPREAIDHARRVEGDGE